MDLLDLFDPVDAFAGEMQGGCEFPEDEAPGRFFPLRPGCVLEVVGFENDDPDVIKAGIVLFDATREALFVDLAQGGAAPQCTQRPQDETLLVQVHQLSNDLVLNLGVVRLRVPADETFDDLLEFEGLVRAAWDQGKPVFARIEICAVNQVGRHECQFSIGH
jgi:hypothetical protein